MVQRTAALAGPRPVYDPAVQHQFEGTGAGTLATPTALAKGPVPASAPPPPLWPPSTSSGIL